MFVMIVVDITIVYCSFFNFLLAYHIRQFEPCVRIFVVNLALRSGFHYAFGVPWAWIILDWRLFNHRWIRHLLGRLLNVNRIFHLLQLKLRPLGHFWDDLRPEASRNNFVRSVTVDKDLLDILILIDQFLLIKHGFGQWSHWDSVTFVD